jgi:hypothetical protein
VVASIHSILSTYYAELISSAPEMDFIYAGFGLKLTTEAQRPRRKVVFPWPGDDGQGKETAGFAGKTLALERGALWR